jgi:SAM-dependent MidA family methyltransferase
MGSPRAFELVELGPGRGTMLKDALRAARIMPGFIDAATIVLVDVASTDALTTELQRAFPNLSIRTQQLSEVSAGEGPAIVLANEFLDTCPLSQIEVTDGRSYLRGVGLDSAERLAFVRRQVVSGLAPAIAESTVFESQDLGVLGKVRRRLASGGAALFVDYGHFDPFRAANHVLSAETFQAVRKHKPEHPLTSPGEADLTCQVDFNAVQHRLSARDSDGSPDLAVDGPVTQAEFLRSLGIMERASRLMAANPAKAAEIEAGVARLMAVPGMGSRFLALGARTPSLPTLPGFEIASRKC